MGDITLPLSKLLLDEQNPRHRPVNSQEAATVELLRRNPMKLLNLTRDIGANGLSPIDRPIVMKAADGKKFVMLEGNRRLIALRMLSKPQTCPDSGLRARFETIAAAALKKPKTVRCYEVADRVEAQPYLDRRHGGEMDGVGVVRWSAMQRTRNSRAPGHQERLALAALDWLDGKSAAGSNQDLADLLDEVAEEKFTTFGRLAGDPDFRAYCGFEVKNDTLIPLDTSSSVVRRLSLVLDDFRSERSLTVSELKRKPDREKYIRELRARQGGADETTRTSDGEEAGLEEAREVDEPAEPSVDSQADAKDSPESAPTGPAAGGRPKSPPIKLFVGASLSSLSLRVRAILSEVQSIPLSRYPNSAAALIRMVIELAVIEAHATCLWADPPQREKKLRHWVDNAMRELDPTGKDARFLALRQQLNQRDSIINTVTLNAFLHNPHYSPDPVVMRSISDSYTPLLNALNDAVKTASVAHA